MEKIVVNVGKTPQGYSASIDLLPGWILGTSGTFVDFKRELVESIEIYLKWAKKDGKTYPAVLDENYEFEYKFDIESLLCFYNGIISRAAIARLTGINERQLGHYACGRSKPLPKQAAKIIDAMHQLGNELIAVSV